MDYGLYLWDKTSTIVYSALGQNLLYSIGPSDKKRHVDRKTVINYL